MSWGPTPFDPNLVAQGVPPDSRANLNDNTYAPVEGTPMPPQAGDAVPPPAPDAVAPPAPEAATTNYDPRTGRYVGPDGNLYQQSDLAEQPETFRDLLPH